MPQKEERNVMVMRDGMAIESDLYADLDDPNQAMFANQAPNDVDDSDLRRPPIPDYHN